MHVFQTTACTRVVMHLVAIIVLSRCGLGIPLLSSLVVTADQYL